MSLLDVLFQVPAWIERGLATGEFIRVGGVVRMAPGQPGGGRVVAWLREASGWAIDPTGLLLSMGQIAQIAYVRRAMHRVQSDIAALGLALRDMSMAVAEMLTRDRERLFEPLRRGLAYWARQENDGDHWNTEALHAFVASQAAIEAEASRLDGETAIANAAFVESLVGAWVVSVAGEAASGGRPCRMAIEGLRAGIQRIASAVAAVPGASRRLPTAAMLRAGNPADIQRALGQRLVEAGRYLQRGLSHEDFQLLCSSARRRIAM